MQALASYLQDILPSCANCACTRDYKNSIQTLIRFQNRSVKGATKVRESLGVEVSSSMDTSSPNRRSKKLSREESPGGVSMSVKSSWRSARYPVARSSFIWSSIMSLPVGDSPGSCKSSVLPHKYCSSSRRPANVVDSLILTATQTPGLRCLQYWYTWQKHTYT